MRISTLVSVVSGRRATFFTVLVGVVALALVVTVLVPKRYVASAQVIVEGRPLVPAGQAPSPVAAEAQLVQSERVSIMVLRLLGLDKDPAVRARWLKATGGAGDFESWAAEELLRRLDVKPTTDSNILTISYAAPDPMVAARTADAFVNAYVQISRELRDESAAQSSASFKGRTGVLKAAVDRAEKSLEEFQHENGVAFTDERLDVETLRLAELSGQLVGLQSAAAAAAGRQRAAARNGAGMEEVLRDPIVQSLSTELAKQEAKMVELEAKAGNLNPMLVEQRSAYEALKARLNAATRRASSSIATESRVAAERVAAVQSALDAQRAKVMEVKGKRDQAQRLLRELELARRAYDAAVIRTNDAVLDSGASRSTVAVVKAATAPSLPTWPRLGVNLVASIVLGLALAIAAAFWRESRDRRLRGDDDVALLGHALLGVISDGRGSPPLLLAAPEGRS